MCAGILNIAFLIFSQLPVQAAVKFIQSGHIYRRAAGAVAKTVTPIAKSSLAAVVGCEHSFCDKIVVERKNCIVWKSQVLKDHVMIGTNSCPVRFIE